MIAVVSYGVCNVGSILSMLRRIGAPAAAVSAPEEIARADKILLPGIGAFDNGMAALTDLGLVEPLRERIAGGVPMLGICLGMQLLGAGSEEGVRPGLDVIGGRCIRFRSQAASPLRIPHMGWNHLAPRQPGAALLADLDARARFYFVHSYHFVCDDPADVLATADYGGDFTAMIHRGTVWGAQFHPEKSHRYGMTLLRNFARL
jgi:glutamine amidotransferase